MADLVERQRCPVCAATGGEVLVRVGYDDPVLAGFLSDFYGGRADPARTAGHDFVVRRCPGCRLAYQVWVPSDALLDDLYERWIDPASSRAAIVLRAEATALAHEALVLDAARALGRPVEGLRVLDFGMGWGGLAAVAKRLGAEPAGIELSAERRDHGRDQGITVLDPDAVEPGTFDVAVALQVLEHSTEPASDVRAMAAAVRPGGLVHVEVPDGSRTRMDAALAALDWSAPKGSRLSLNPVAPLQHLNCYEPATLATLLATAGLTKVRTLAPHPLIERVKDRLRPPLARRITGRRP